nr:MULTISPECIES: hypothetical protein [unclassified Trichocoleus]
MWSEVAWRRKPDIKKMNVSILEQGEKLWLYRVEEAVLMVEVRPTESAELNPGAQVIGQVVLKRLITAEQVLEWLSTSSSVCTQGDD